jgi:hypothetical protein
MTYQHFIPATFLAGFSSDGNPKRRKRRLFVGDLKTKKFWHSRVESMGGENNFYDLSGPEEKKSAIDDSWGIIEGKISKVIEKLINGTVTGKEWLGVLVPFISSILVRGVDFPIRFTQRMQLISDDISIDNINFARLLDLEFLLAPVLAGEWLLFKKEGEGSFITNDVGFTGFKNNMGKKGVAIPITNEYLLGIVPKRKRIILKYMDNDWQPLIKRISLNINNHNGFNLNMAKTTKRFIYGRDENVIKSLLQESEGANVFLDPFIPGLFLSGRNSKVHKNAWHKLTSMVHGKNNSEHFWNFKIDWHVLKNIWYPMMQIFYSNIPDYQHPFRKYRRKITVNLYKVSERKFENNLLKEL